MALKRYRVQAPTAQPFISFYSLFTKVFTRVLVDDELKDSTWEINNTGHTEKLITTRIR